MKNHIEKAKQIKLAIFDVDGILTKGGLYYSTEGIEIKEFHVHDGMGIKLLLQAGIQVGIITSCHSPIVTKRMQDLGVPYVYQGQKDKLPVYEELKNRTQISDENILYMGDDFPDLPILSRVGLGVTVADAPKIIQQYAAWTTQAKGGHGAVREVCEFLLESQDLYQKLVEKYLA